MEGGPAATATPTSGAGSGPPQPRAGRWSCPTRGADREQRLHGALAEQTPSPGVKHDVRGFGRHGAPPSQSTARRVRGNLR